jgi:hypothetical protein
LCPGCGTDLTPSFREYSEIRAALRAAFFVLDLTDCPFAVQCRVVLDPGSGSAAFAPDISDEIVRAEDGRPGGKLLEKVLLIVGPYVSCRHLR